MGLGLGIYSALASLTLPPLLPAFALHPRLRGGLWQRLGGGPPVPCPRNAVWLHGSSAGDVVALVPLVERLAAQGMPVTLSTWTRSGELMARQRLDPRTVVFRQPLDFAGPVGLVLRRIRPTMLVLECLELWPRLVACSLRQGVKVAVVNGRLSEKSLRRYRRARWLFRSCFEGLSLVTALDEAHASRFIAAGVPADRVTVLGSSKHAAGSAAAYLPTSSGRPRLVLGSLHREEESLLLPWLSRLLAAVTGLEVIVAPRYPQRARSIVRRLGRSGIPVALESAGEAAAVRVVDHVGHLAELYRGARVAFVGGSLVAHGGHNVVEAAAGGAFVVTGPHLAHCASEAHDLQQAGAAAVVDGGAAFFELAARRLADVDLARQVARSAHAVVGRLAGAADQVAARLVELAAGGRR